MTNYGGVDREEAENSLQQVKITNIATQQQPRLCSKSGYLFPMEYEEVAGKRESTLYHTAGDNHLYRFNRPLNAAGSKLYVYCYHVKITRNAEVTEECHASGVLDREAKQISLSRPHNHEPDLRLLSRLRVRNKILQEAEVSDAPLAQVFKDATCGMEGAELVEYGSMYR